MENKEYALLVQDFFAGIFDTEIDPSRILMPVIPPGFLWMVMPKGLASAKIYEKIEEHLNVVPGSFLKLEEKNLMLSCPQERPIGTYVYSYSGEQSPDVEYVGMSQEDVAKIKLSFMTIPEYLLATAFNKFRCNEFLDLYSETILAECWSFGGMNAGMVYGFHQHRGRNLKGHDPEGYDGVCLFSGPPAARSSTLGIRKVVF